MSTSRPSSLPTEQPASELLEYSHEPVMRQEVARYLAPAPGASYLDATFGGGGHACEILDASAPDGVVVGIDSNPQAIALGQQRYADYGRRLILRRGNFRDLAELWASAKVTRPLRGVLFDLGLSSAELMHAAWGFSFQAPAPLTMRYDTDPESGLTAAEIINTWLEERLVEVLRRYGQEPLARPITQMIIRERPFTTTTELADAIARVCVRRYGRRSKRHPATRTFQALRIAVNDELEVLAEGLAQAVELLVPGGAMVVISYHSLEDGLVKRFFKSAPRLEILTKRPLVPTEIEMQQNPRSRSAKFRAAQKKF